jgi:DUF4097 and DUF4098 domain-containing protein YvlB
LLFLIGQARPGLWFWGKTWPIVLLVWGVLKLGEALASSEGHIGTDAAVRPRRRSVFGGVLLILMGLVFLAQNFHGDFGFMGIFWKWWPLLLILAGVSKLLDRLAARRTVEVPPHTITGGELGLIVILILLGLGVGAAHRFQNGGYGAVEFPGSNEYSFSQDVPVKSVPANSHISIRTQRGDVVVRAEEVAAIQVIVKTRARGWSEDQARRLSSAVRVAIAPDGDGYEVRPKGEGNRVSVDLEVHVPRQAMIVARTERGAVQVTGILNSVSVTSGRGDVEVRDAGGDVDVNTRHGDVKIAGANGDVKLSGSGRDVDISDVAGSASVDGEFYDPIRLEKIAKGVHYLSQRTDLTVTQVTGRVELTSGGLEVTDAPGNLNLKTREKDITVENLGGRVRIENRNGNVTVRFAQPPKDDVEVMNQSAGITVTLPAKSSFDVHAEAKSGDIDSEFDVPSVTKISDNHGNTKLDGTVGTRGPQIRLKTTYGSISIRKAS